MLLWFSLIRTHYFSQKCAFWCWFYVIKQLSIYPKNYNKMKSRQITDESPCSQANFKMASSLIEFQAYLKKYLNKQIILWIIKTFSMSLFYKNVSVAAKKIWFLTVQSNQQEERYTTNSTILSKAVQ